MRERLLDYLFGQLSEKERIAIEGELARDPALRAELARLRACTQAGDEVDQLEPPSGLAERTCRYVAEACGDSAAASGGEYRVASAAREGEAWSQTTYWTLTDLALAAGIVLAAAMLLFPALQESRYVARRGQCADNLRALGDVIMAYSRLSGSRYPLLPETGELSFGGSIPMQLVEAGVLNQNLAAQWVTCPASKLAQRTRTGDFAVYVPSTQEFLNANGRRRLLLRELMGSLAFRAGYRRGDDYVPIRLDYSPRSPIASDAPSLHLTDFQSDNHGGLGLNVLFSDGHVEFISGCTALRCGDKIFLNRANLRGPGCDATDAVLFGAQEPLYRNVRQLKIRVRMTAE